MKCGLLGRSLKHSYSPMIHTMLGDYPYTLIEKEPEELKSFLENGDFTGINVTIPYKKDVIPYLDQLTPRAKILGAVNTIVKMPDGKLLGHNTDYYGFLSMVNCCQISVSGKKALVLGSGGASNTACAVLRELGAEVIVISRKGENNYTNLHLHSDAAILVNTTPVGMYPYTGISPVDLTIFPKLEYVLDVIYNPAKTQLLLDAEKLGIRNVNGLWMLVAQAKEAAEYFTGKTISNEAIATIHHKLSRQMQNIILIGMPGCGKSAVGKLLAEATGKTFVDADAEIVKRAGKSIPDIFSEGGEDAFRTIETEVIQDLGMQSGLVIATGGGCVTRSENAPLLRQNGQLFWLKRDISLLPKEGRPLSMKNDLQKMYEIRKPMYSAFADQIVDNNGLLDETIQHILDCWEESE